MHAQLTPSTQAAYPLDDFERGYREANATATAVGFSADDPDGERDGAIVIPMKVETHVFGTLESELLVPAGDDGVEWTPHLLFPGLRPGEELTRRSEAPRRGRILSVDGKVLAEGPPEARVSPLGTLGGSIAGSMGQADDEAERLKVFARGFDADSLIGISGLERVFERELAGRPAATLSADGRVIAQSRPRPGKNVRTTINSNLQQAAVTALAGRLGGIAALDARTAEVRALAGIAFSAPQPPGSTFKIITTTAALEQRLVKKTDQFPVESFAADRRRRARERERRVLRRQLQGQLRPLVQLGLRPARGQGGRPPPGRRRGALRLERAALDRRARCRARCPRPTRSSPRWRSARPRSASSRCWPPPS